MKTLVTFFLTLVLFNSALANPNVMISRYKAGEFKDLPSAIITDPKAKIDPWVTDDSRWPEGRTACLIPGFPFFDEYSENASLTSLAEFLSQIKKADGTPAYISVYAVKYSKGFHIYDTASILADTLHVRCVDWPQGMKFDMFAHSMGGLVARSAIELPEDILSTKNLSDRVARLVSMGTPHNGFPAEEIGIFSKYCGLCPEVADMDSTGIFISKCLNIVKADKPKVDCDYYSIVGMRSYRPKNFLDNKIGILSKVVKELKDDLTPVHYGLVSADSAGYDLSPFCLFYKKSELDLNHDYIMRHTEVFATIQKWIVEDDWFSKLSNKQFKRQFYYNYEFEPEPGKRSWFLDNNEIWYEHYPSGHINTFRLIKRSIVNTVAGGIFQREDRDEGDIQVFIPDIEAKSKTALVRSGTDGNWYILAEMNTP